MTEKITNDVKKIQLNKYVEFTDYLAEHLFNFPQVISVYQMGGWTQPGISDIDLIVVVKELDKSEYKELNVLNKILARNSDDEYMLMHAPFVITEQAFKNLDLFFYCSDLKRLKGKEIAINKNPSDLQEIAELYKLVSVLAHTYPRFYSFENKKSLRSFLTFGYSLKHTYRIIREFDISFQNNEIEDYIQRVTDLRKNVIELDSVEQDEINFLIEFGIKISKIMFKKVDDIIKNRISFKPGKTDFLYIKNLENIFSFVNGSNSFKIERNDGVNFLELPHSFSVFILMPSKNGILSNAQSKKVIGKNSVVINEQEKELLECIEKPFLEYNRVFKKCHVFNGMSFELNTPFIWDSRKYRTFNALDYARRFKHIVLTKKNEIKVSKLINNHNS